MKKTYNIFKKIGRRNLALTIVALILTSVMLVGATYSWIENITAVQITNTTENGTGTDTSKLKMANDINSAIELGSCGPDSDDGTTSKFNAVNLGSYFNESGGMHLTTCSGNGDSFYFKTLKGSTGAKDYRIGTEDDENVNYISATFMVSSPDAEVDMWFNEIPKVSCDGNYNTDSIAKYSITVDGETNVYSSSGGEYAHIIDAEGNTAQVPVRKTAEYTYGNSQNVKDGKENGNVLFRVGETPKKVTIRIWLQYTEGTDNYSDLKSNINMVLVSTWAKTRKITIRDCTSQNMNEYWMTEENSPKLYVALASDPDKYHWELTVDKTKKTGSVNIPSYYYTGDKISVLRCENGWNTGNVRCNGILCWNYWETELPKGFENLMFNIVGNTPAINDGSTKQSDTGYSFWGVAEQITVTDNVGLTHAKGENANRMLVRDVDTGNYYPLYDTGSGWRGYIPRTSDKIEFLYKENTFSSNAINSINSTGSSDSCYKNETPDYKWGYTSSMDYQTRPYDDVTYTILSTGSGTWTDLIETNYRLGGYFSGSSTWTEDIKFYKETEDAEVAYAYKYLTKDTLSQIKVLNVSSGSYYSNTGVMCRSNSSGWVMKTSVSPNMGLISDGYDGTYKFEFNITTKKLSVTYPGEGGKSRVYLVTNNDGYDKYAYMWQEGTSYKNADYPGQKMSWFAEINGYHIYWLKYTDGVYPNKIIFSGKTDGTEVWKTGNLDFKEAYQLYTIDKS
ncbi:MAG: hypothetical protein ACI4HO_10260 [Ruminococcus sp.]